MSIALSEWLKLTDTNKRNIFAETARQKALPISSIEKDWWWCRHYPHCSQRNTQIN